LRHGKNDNAECQEVSQHLEETRLQKNRLERIIMKLGGKPTHANADLLRLNPPSKITARSSSKEATKSKRKKMVKKNVFQKRTNWRN
jgi:hypothetical protein